MKKIVFLDPQAYKEFHHLERIIQKEFYSIFALLQMEGKLDYPHAKKIEKNLFEIRIKVQNIYRGFYAYLKLNQIVILHIFQKKTQKTPLQNLKTAQRRLNKYEY